VKMTEPRIVANSKRDGATRPRKEVEELLFRAGHLRHWENEILTPVLLVYYCYAKAVHDVVRTGSIAEAAAALNANERSIRRANAVGARTFEWFHEKWMHRSDAGERLTRRHIEALALTTLPKERAALACAKARVESTRKIESATRREKGPQRPILPNLVEEPLPEAPTSGIFLSRSGSRKHSLG
jgi:hypothetical protein